MTQQLPASPTASVALATYNGERYLREFLDSLAAQTLRGIEVVASDDASKDNTVALLRGYDALPVRVIAHDTNQGVLRNFAAAIEGTRADHVFFADQDDFWESDKLELMTQRLRAIEAEHGVDHPALVFCDLRIVDEHLRELEPSYFLNTGKVPDAVDLRDYIVSNHVPGCAIVVNRALIRRALPIPDTVYLHDWWFMLVATIFGTVASVRQPLIRYRQHGNNTVGFVGAPKSKLSRLLRYAHKPGERWRKRRDFYRVAAGIVERNVAALRTKYAGTLPPEAARVLDRLNSPRWHDRLLALRGAKTGESTVATLMITGQMWRERV